MDKAVQNENEFFSTCLFWDVDLSDLNMEKHKTFIVARVLDYGNWEDWLFIRNYYGLEKIKEIALQIRSLERKSLAFIAIVTQTPEEQFRCYKQLQSNNRHWYF